MSEITIKNDGRLQSQSFKAEFEYDGSDNNGGYYLTCTGFGFDEYNSKINLVQQVDNLIKNLKRFKDEIEII